VDGQSRVPADAVVLLAASAGGVPALLEIVAGLPAGFPAAVIVVCHRTARTPSLLRELLARRTVLTVREVSQGDTIEAGTIYVAPPDLHVLVQPDRTLALTDGRLIRYVRSSANPLFESAGRVFRDRVVAVVLTGWGMDATDGVQAVASHGGIVIAQDPASAQVPGMPTSAIQTGCVQLVVPLPAIATTVVGLVGARAA
jgi:two-component system chemotaxis response regulator CheB